MDSTGNVEDNKCAAKNNAHVKNYENDNTNNYKAYYHQNDNNTNEERGAGCYNIARGIILRGMAIVYIFAFSVAYNQNPGLISSKGIMPFRTTPQKGEFSLFHYNMIAPNDENLNLISILGIILSVFLLVRPIMFFWSGILNLMPWLILYALYLTLLHAGKSSSSFFQYGWESQILETGLIATFLSAGGSWITSNVLPSSSSSSYSYPYISMICMWLYRWLILRISIGAGLIKFRGDGCWHDRTCLWYHFETQPIPSPTSYYYHNLPQWILSYGVDVDFAVQLYFIWLCILFDVPSSLIGSVEKRRSVTWWLVRIRDMIRYLRAFGGFVQIMFMINIASSGNLSFLNLLTAIPPFACIDDGVFCTFYSFLRKMRPSLLVLFFMNDTLEKRTTQATTTTITENENTDSQLLSLNSRQTVQMKESGSKNTSQQKLTISSNHDEMGIKSNTLSAFIRSQLLQIQKVFLYATFLTYMGIVIFLSIPVVENLLQSNGRRQAMNASFGPPWLQQFSVLNTYGAFGSVGKARYEPIVMVQFDQHELERYYLESKTVVVSLDSNDSLLQCKKSESTCSNNNMGEDDAHRNNYADKNNNNDELDKRKNVLDLFENYDREGFTMNKIINKNHSEVSDIHHDEDNSKHPNTSLLKVNPWFELEFKCKPGLVSRRPCFIAPYQYRIDWNIWFLGFIPQHNQMLMSREVWLISFLNKIMENDDTVLSLLASEKECGNACINTWMNRGSEKFLRPKSVRVDMYHYWFARDSKFGEPIDPDKPKNWPPQTHTRPISKSIAGVANVRGIDLIPKSTNITCNLWWNRAWSSSLIPPVDKDVIENAVVEMSRQRPD